MYIITTKNELNWNIIENTKTDFPYAFVDCLLLIRDNDNGYRTSTACYEHGVGWHVLADHFRGTEEVVAWLYLEEVIPPEF